MTESLLQLDAEDASGARAGRLHMPSGPVDTPAFMPVATRGTVKAIWLEDVAALGYRLLLANAYHLYLRPGVDRVSRAGGLHRFMRWPHHILTDSGGYQVFSLAHMRKVEEAGVWFRSHIDGSEHRLTPADVVGNQLRLGSDLIMPLDVCTGVEAGRAEAEQALVTTHRWLQASVAAWRERPHERPNERRGQLFAIMQGHFDPELRRRSAAEVAAYQLPGNAVGGLSVGESREQLVEFMHLSVGLLPADRPRYVMGVGSPDYAVEAVASGADMFDCVYPTRVARNGQALTDHGVVALKAAAVADSDEPILAGCSCRVCRGGYSRGYLRHLFNQNEIMAAVATTLHNLSYMADLMARMRSAIAAGTFVQFRRSFLADYRRPGDGGDEHTR